MISEHVITIKVKKQISNVRLSKGARQWGKTNQGKSGKMSYSKTISRNLTSLNEKL